MRRQRIEPVAESFGDLDPKPDLREVNLAVGQEWTGWHRIEEDLWGDGRRYGDVPERRSAIGDQLVT